MMTKSENVKKYQVIGLLRDAKWQINNMKQTHFSKADVLEMFDDLINTICKEED